MKVSVERFRKITQLMPDDVMFRFNGEQCKLKQVYGGDGNPLEFVFFGFVVNQKCMPLMFENTDGVFKVIAEEER